MKRIAFALAALLPISFAAEAQPLTEAQVQAAYAALDDEYHAQSFYAAVIAKFGAVRPFSNIIKAEQTHAALVIEQLKASGAPIPANPYANGSKALPAVPASKAEACAVAVQAEIANMALYNNTLLPAAVDNSALTQVFIALRDASLNKHLPAFKRCAG